jgi:hypothetical protein
MFGILDHVTVTTRTCYNSNLECILIEFNAKQSIKLNVRHHRSCYENALHFPPTIFEYTNVHATQDILLIIETIVLVGKTSFVLVITQPKSMSFHCINHFVNVKLKELVSAPHS